MAVYGAAECLMARYRNEPWFVASVPDGRRILLMVKESCPFGQHRKLDGVPVVLAVACPYESKFHWSERWTTPKMKAITMAAVSSGLRPDTVKSRIRNGMTLKQATETPLMAQRWRNVELERLRKHVLLRGITDSKELSKLMGRDAKSVRRKAKEMGLV